MKLSLAYSPCPNDTFIFDAMVHHKVDTEGLDFEIQLHDVEALNKMALNHDVAVTKLSFNAFLHVYKKYALLSSGSALGEKCGPLLILKEDKINSFNTQSLVATPGKYTTANSLFSLAYPNNTNTKEMLFSEIEEAVLNGDVDAGVIIHENRFTYQDKGLEKLMDLGEYWEEQTQLPIPLGGIVVSKTLDVSIQKKVQRVLRRSVEFAFQNPEESKDYVKQHAQEMDMDVMNNHIQLYVNSYSLDLGEKGRKAVRYLFERKGMSIRNLDFI
jgi:1,4-dihydroxy-6-naphthoate synthase